MPIHEEPKRKTIDAYFDQRKNVLGVSKTVGRSSRDVIEMMTMHKQVLQLPQMVMHGDTHGNNKKYVNQKKKDYKT
jgi:hypothetical protein